MSAQYCLSCMRSIPSGGRGCPVCGSSAAHPPVSPNALRPGTILSGKYLVGKTLGQGGFGITYLGLDLVLQKKVAIKEYYPSCTGMVTRQNGGAVLWVKGSLNAEGQEMSRQSFLKEARKMARVGSVPGIVTVDDLFSENNTSYIVMDFVEGETLANVLQQTGIMSFADCTQLMMPMISSLSQMHDRGIIHRDISPDNIMVKKDGSIMLLDLGAAKEINIQKKDGTMQSSQLIHKNGFSPIEQYISASKIGSWTDVYATCATMYYCCTGMLPPMATERVNNTPLQRHANLSSAEYALLAEGMAVDSKDRIQNMRELAEKIQKITKRRSIHASGKAHNPISSSIKHFDQKKASSFFEDPLCIAGLILGAEAAVKLFTGFADASITPAVLMQVCSYLLALYAILQKPINKNIFACGLLLLGAAYFSFGMLSTYAAASAMFLGGVLVLLNSSSNPARREWLPRYWGMVFVLFAAYAVMLCLESFTAFDMLTELAFGAAMYLVFRQLISGR